MSKIDELYYVEENSFGEPWTRERLETELNNRLSLWETESVGEKLCAYALGRVIADEAELLKLAVAPECRRQGIAKRLLLALHKQMKENGAEVCFLEVRAQNLPAIALYEKLGYRRLRVIRGYYPDDDGIAMRCEL